MSRRHFHAEGEAILREECACPWPTCEMWLEVLRGRSGEVHLVANVLSGKKKIFTLSREAAQRLAEAITKP